MRIITNDSSIGLHILYEMNKDKFDKVARIVMDKLKNKEKEIKDNLLDGLNFTDEEAFNHIKERLSIIDKHYMKLEMSSKHLLNITFSELINTLGLHSLDSNLLLNEFEKLTKELIKEKESNCTYNITINTHGCDTKSPQELAEKIIDGVRKLSK